MAVVTFKVELANKIRNGRAVGNLWGVGTYVDGRRTCYAIEPQESEDVARRFVRDAHSPADHSRGETREEWDERRAGC